MGEAVREAGFTDIVAKRFKKPLNCTGPDAKLREIGSYTYASLAEGLEGEGATAASRTPIPNPQPPPSKEAGQQRLIFMGLCVSNP